MAAQHIKRSDSVLGEMTWRNELQEVSENRAATRLQERNLRESQRAKTTQTENQTKRKDTRR